MIRYKIDHETVYNYTQPVVTSQHLAHMLPRPCSRQNWLSHSLEISPEPAARQERTDYYGNRPLAFCLEEEHLIFRVKASGTVEVHREKPPEASIHWENAAERIARPSCVEDWEASAYAYNSPIISYNEAIRRYASESFTTGRHLFEAAVDLNSRIFNEFKYSPGATRIGCKPYEILRERKGVCQDFSHLMIACLRSHGLACRYVSGYLLTKAPEGQAKLIGSDATHAWVAVYIPAHGWIELDPTNNLIVADEHIIIAWGRDFSDVSPLKGVIMGGGPHSVKVGVNVEQLHDERG